MSWSENLFNLVGIGELSYPEALAKPEHKSHMARGLFHYNPMLHEARAGQQYKWKWSCQREKYFEMRSNGSSQTREPFLSGSPVRPGTIENYNTNSSEGGLESIMDH